MTSSGYTDSFLAVSLSERLVRSASKLISKCAQMNYELNCITIHRCSEMCIAIVKWRPCWKAGRIQFLSGEQNPLSSKKLPHYLCHPTWLPCKFCIVAQRFLRFAISLKLCNTPVAVSGLLYANNFSYLFHCSRCISFISIEKMYISFHKFGKITAERL